MKTALKVIQNQENPMPVEVLAESISSIAQGVKKLLAGPLNERALILLIQNACPTVGKFPPRAVTQKEVKSVLDGICSLEKEYLKPKK